MDSAVEAYAEMGIKSLIDASHQVRKYRDSKKCGEIYDPSTRKVSKHYRNNHL